MYTFKTDKIIEVETPADMVISKYAKWLDEFKRGDRLLFKTRDEIEACFKRDYKQACYLSGRKLAN